jgi:hypothetical protein
MRNSLIAALAAIILAGAAHAQPQTPGPAKPLDAATRKAVVDQVAKLLHDRYIYPQVGDRAGRRIEARLAAGAYDGISDPTALGKALTADLDSIAHDKHLQVFTAQSTPPPEGPEHFPPTEGGFVRADRLPGDVGYLEVVGFPEPLTVFRAGADPAMAAVARSRALILDLRRNGGGSPRAVNYLLSYFFPAAKTVHVSDIIWRNAGTDTFRTDPFFTVATPGKYLGRPVVILTSRRTFSGGEDFVYNMQALGRARVVGEVTGGGAHPGGEEALPDGLAIFIPMGRSENPVTKTDWEGVGVKPDLAVPADLALQAALKSLGVTAPATTIDALSQARLFTARTTVQPGSQAALRRYVESAASGRFDDAALSPDWVAPARKDLAEEAPPLARLGALQTVTFDRLGPFADNVYTLGFAHGSWTWTVLLDHDGKVSAAFPLGPPKD